MKTSKIILGYFIYLPIALVLTYYVAKTLFKNSTVFMIEIFKGKEEIANATNTLFKVGFYLLNIGFALLILKINAHEINETYQSLIEILSKKIGGFSIYLGFMLFLNMFLFFRGRKKSKTMQVPTNLVVKD
ncbi:hypothetical protein [Cellulophaga tyrosinoxydans]|uniref:Integral membrane protein n=1 Tax=Cellulophaga tyrosinoxydans TaxID=504486 RepID=A0A1W2AXF4_9FLAO|nr:hypothetical protein [Cellulophaga tyrosinoxydans]SMC65376.1 hypothetical protein SAMN05660703_2290 [Cellulophaga tyrosinoxydans]